MQYMAQTFSKMALYLTDKGRNKGKSVVIYKLEVNANQYLYVRNGECNGDKNFLGRRFNGKAE